MIDLLLLSQKIRKMESRKKPFNARCIPNQSAFLECPVGVLAEDGCFEPCGANLKYAPQADIKVLEKNGIIRRTRVLVCPECHSKVFR
jgi:hypothetical protein